MDTVLLVGGAGTIGKKLAHELAKEYNVYILDHVDPHIKSQNIHFIQIDAGNPEDLNQKIPMGAVALVNLLNTNTKDSLEDKNQFENMTNLFFRSSYYLFREACKKNIPKVVFASTNHVTDYYEEDGLSQLEREITPSDMPKSKDLYGVLKFASEQLGFLFSTEKNLSVINLRIGTVPKSLNKRYLLNNPRVQHTLLTDPDLIQLFRSAIQIKRKTGTYYAVSANKEKPWSIVEAENELNFSSLLNAQDLLDK